MRGIPGGLLLCCLLSAAPLHADDIRTWVDAGGTVHFGDRNTAPKDSKPVELSPGSVVEMVPAPSAPAPAEAAAPPAPVAKARVCTPVMQTYVDPRTGMHSERDTGRCEEDGDVRENTEYPYYNWAGPCIGPNCLHPPHPPRPPRPPLPPDPAPPVVTPFRAPASIGGSPLIPF